jgi:hypothetical protein
MSMSRNPVFWLMWILPGAAVLASFATLAIALQHGDRPLPTLYHWEGERLDADFERARQAAREGMRATIAFGGDGRPCTVTLAPAPGDPASVALSLTSASDAGLDRTLILQRVQAGVYRAPCDALSRGRWRAVLQDSSAQWALRGNVDDAVRAAVLEARSPEG